MNRIEIGPQSLKVDGIELAKYIGGFSLIAQGHEPPILTVMVNSWNDLALAFEGEVSFVKSETGMSRELERITRVLASLSAKKIEEEALAQQEWGDGASMTASIIRVIQERVLGAEPHEHQEGSGAPAPG